MLLPAIAGCGSQVPDEFTVSGQPLDYWLDALSDGRPELRLKAVRALGNVGPEVPDIVPALTDALSDPDSAVRAQAVLALLKYGSAAKEAIPALADAQNDSDETVKDLAARALERIRDE